jgi:hypothetical protein
MKRKVLADRKGVSPVIASVILCSVVLVVGVSTWSYCYSVSNVLQSNYYEGVKAQIDAVRERFTVEHVAYLDGKLRVWVYNYGEVNIEVDVYARGAADGSNTAGTAVPSRDVVDVVVPLTVKGGDELSITVMSRRQNFVYATYIVPST